MSWQGASSSGALPSPDVESWLKMPENEHAKAIVEVSANVCVCVLLAREGLLRPVTCRACSMVKLKG